MNTILAISAVLFLPSICIAGQDYAAWSIKNQDGSWTKLTEAAVTNSRLPNLNPSDINNFCPAYPALTPTEKVKFWTGLISAIAKPESNFKPQTKYKENFKDAKGDFVISRGLLQISQESANQKKYGCAISKATDLHDPGTNLACGVKILSALVNDDNVIATYKKDKNSSGGGKYWSTLRQSSKSFNEIKGYTNKLSFCKKPS